MSPDQSKGKDATLFWWVFPRGDENIRVVFFPCFHLILLFAAL